MTDSKNPQPEASAATEAAPQQAAQAEAAGKPARRTTARRTARKTAEKTVEKSVEKAGAPVAPKIVDVDDPSLYINREISWIEFDRKVLETAADPTVPLLQRVQFLAIFFNNLDEFYMVRVMNLQRQARMGAEPTGADRMPPARQLTEIRRKVTEMLEVAEDLWLKTLKPALEKKDIKFGRYSQLSPKRRSALDRYFDRQIFPILTPQAVDAGHPFPMISNTSINFVVELEGVHADEPGKVRFGRVKCPNNVPRFLFLPEDADETTVLDVRSREGTIIMVEDLIMQRMEKLFPGYRVRSQGLFRITRNTDGEIEEDEADDLLAAVRDYVEQRRFGSIVRLELERGMPQCLQDFLVKHLGTRPYQVFKSRMPLAFSEFMGLGGIDRPALKYPPFHPTLPEALERLVREGRLRDPSTVVVLKRLFAECPDEAEAQIRRAMRENGTISRAAARKLLSDASNARRPHRTGTGVVSRADEAARHFSRDAYWDALPDVTGGRDCRAISRFERRHIVVEWVDSEDRLRSGYLTPNWLSNDPNVVCVTSKGKLFEVNVAHLTIAGIFPSSEIDLGRLAHE